MGCSLRLVIYPPGMVDMAVDSHSYSLLMKGRKYTRTHGTIRTACNSWEVVDRLIVEHRLSKLNALCLKFVLSAAVYVRSSAYLFYKSQRDFILYGKIMTYMLYLKSSHFRSLVSLRF